MCVLSYWRFLPSVAASGAHEEACLCNLNLHWQHSPTRSLSATNYFSYRRSPLLTDSAANLKLPLPVTLALSGCTAMAPSLDPLPVPPGRRRAGPMVQALRGSGCGLLEVKGPLRVHRDGQGTRLVVFIIVVGTCIKGAAGNPGLTNSTTTISTVGYTNTSARTTAAVCGAGQYSATGSGARGPTVAHLVPPRRRSPVLVVAAAMQRAPTRRGPLGWTRLVWRAPTRASSPSQLR